MLSAMFLKPLRYFVSDVSLIHLTCEMITCNFFYRSRSRAKRTRKYGLLTRTDKLEMQPLDADDDEDEDVTVYEMNGRPR